MFHIFKNGYGLDKFAQSRQGLATGNNKKFLRKWFEVLYNEIGFNYNSNEDFHASLKKYAPHNKGGYFRKWYGNCDFIIKFDKSNFNILSNLGNHLPSKNYYFKESLSWSKLSSGRIGFRLYPNGFLFDHAAGNIFCKYGYEYYILGLLNSNVSSKILSFISPTLNYEVGHISSLPIFYNKSFTEKIRIYVR